MPTLRLEIDVNCDDTVYNLEDPIEWKWFMRKVLNGPLALHSNEIGDEIGEARLVSACILPQGISRSRSQEDQEASRLHSLADAHQEDLANAHAEIHRLRLDLAQCHAAFIKIIPRSYWEAIDGWAHYHKWHTWDVIELAYATLVSTGGNLPTIIWSGTSR